MTTAPPTALQHADVKVTLAQQKCGRDTAASGIAANDTGALGVEISGFDTHIDPAGAALNHVHQCLQTTAPAANIASAVLMRTE